MSFFNINSKYSPWLFIVMGISLAIMTSTSVIAAESNSENKQVLPTSIVIDKVFVDKSARTLQLLSDDKVIKSYHIALGGNPIGHKQQQGDQRTPVGSYTLDYKNEKSKF